MTRAPEPFTEFYVNNRQLPEFLRVKNKLASVLHEFRGQLVTSMLMHEMQRACDRVFIARQRQYRPLILEGAGLEVTGVKIAVATVVTISHWRTKFHPTDVYNISVAHPNAVPLGYGPGRHQFWFEHQVFNSVGPDRNHVTATAQEASAPDHLLHLAWRRAVVLGHVKG